MMNNVVLVASENLRLVFDRRGDRWRHRIEVLHDGMPITTLSSIEGVATDDWPPSPAFQNLDIQTFPGKGQIALLVGKAGSSHWSAAIEPDTAAAALRFDIACRIANESRFLGSAYAIERADADPQARLPTITLPEIPDECRQVMETTADRLTICAIPELGPLPRTVRWQFVVSFLEPVRIWPVDHTHDDEEVGH
jgi:hypothetical protein